MHKTDIPVISGLPGHNDAEFLPTFTFALPKEVFQTRPNLSSGAKGRPKFGATIGNKWGFFCEAISSVVCDLPSDINTAPW